MTDMAMGLPLRQVFERAFATHDGVELFYRHWPAIHGPTRGAIVLFHRGHEHSGRMAHLVDELALPDFDFFAWDSPHGTLVSSRRASVRCSSPPGRTTTRRLFGAWYSPHRHSR